MYIHSLKGLKAKPMGRIISVTDDVVRAFYDDTIAMLEISEYLDNECKPTLCGKRFITDTKLAQKLDITKRALQDYRDKGLISYYRLDGKILYSEDDVDDFLRSSYRPKFC